MIKLTNKCQYEGNPSIFPRVTAWADLKTYRQTDNQTDDNTDRSHKDFLTMLEIVKN